MATSYLTKKKGAATAKNKAPDPSALPVPPAPSPPPAPEDAQQEYERFLSAAKALDAASLRPYRADAVLAYHNVALGVDAVIAHEAQIKAELPKVDLAALKALPALALAVGFAALQVDRGAGAPSNLAPRLARARELRSLLLTSADALAQAGVLPARAVTKIRQGRGSIDAAQDCVDLAALFGKFAAESKGKTPVTPAQVSEAGKLGTELLTVLKPKRARSGPTKGGSAVEDAAGIRDRMWTLLVKGSAELRRVGMWLWMDEVEAHVPPLQSRVAVPRKKAGAPKGA